MVKLEFEGKKTSNALLRGSTELLESAIVHEETKPS